MPMYAPDGTVGDVDQAHIEEAVKGGFQFGHDVIAPDGTRGTVAPHHLRKAFNTAGYRLVLKGTHVFDPISRRVKELKAV